MEVEEEENLTVHVLYRYKCIIIMLTVAHYGINRSFIIKKYPHCVVLVPKQHGRSNGCTCVLYHCD